MVLAKGSLASSICSGSSVTTRSEAGVLRQLCSDDCGENEWRTTSARAKPHILGERVMRAPMQERGQRGVAAARGSLGGFPVFGSEQLTSALAEGADASDQPVASTR